MSFGSTIIVLPFVQPFLCWDKIISIHKNLELAVHAHMAESHKAAKLHEELDDRHIYGHAARAILLRSRSVNLSIYVTLYTL